MLVYTKVPSKKAKRRPAKAPAKVRKKRKEFKEYQPNVTVYRAPDTSGIKSHIDEYLESKAPINKVPLQYEGELAAREAAAQEEIKRKGKCVAPAFNKGNYTYIATEEQAKWVGKK